MGWKKSLFFLLPVIFTLLMGCPTEKSPEEQEGPPPEEAKYFENLALASPLKEYGHGNPIMTQNFGADPWALVWEDRVYVYMTGDTPIVQGGVIQRNNYDNITTIRILSSSDLVNWTEHPAVRAAGSTGAAKWAARSWAPAAAYKNIAGQAKFFLYFANGANGIGVLSADTPTGPFTDPRGSALINSSTPNCNDVVWLFDPAVLVDDDGKAYLYFGGGTPTNTGQNLWNNTAHSNHPMPGTIRAVELGADMTSLAGTPVRLDVPFGFEDSGCFKYRGVYYYTYCANRGVEPFALNQQHPDAIKIGKSMSLVYMTSDKPMSGFALRNMTLTNPGEMFGIRYGNNHHTIFEFRNKWYIVYHSRLLAHAMGLDDEGRPSAEGEGYRITHIDAVNIGPDGTIDQIQGTRTGVEQAGRFNPYRQTDAATMAVMAGISAMEYQPLSGPPRMKVTGISSGSWIALRGVNFGSAGAKKFKCTVKPPESGFGVIQLRQDSPDGNPIGYVVAEAGKSGEIEVDLLRTVTNVHDLVFVFYGEGYDFEQWQFVQ